MLLHSPCFESGLLSKSYEGLGLVRVKKKILISDVLYVFCVGRMILVTRKYVLVVLYPLSDSH